MVEAFGEVSWNLRNGVGRFGHGVNQRRVLKGVEVEEKRFASSLVER